MDYIKEAKKLGFSNAAIMDTQKLLLLTVHIQK